MIIRVIGSDLKDYHVDPERNIAGISDEALQKRSNIGDILASLSSLRYSNEQLNQVPEILKLLASRTNLSNDEKDAMGQVFDRMLSKINSNSTFTSAPEDENERRFQFGAFIKGMRLICETLKEKSDRSELDSEVLKNTLIEYQEAFNACFERWKGLVEQNLNQLRDNIGGARAERIDAQLQNPREKFENRIFKYIYDTKVSVINSLMQNFVMRLCTRDSLVVHYEREFKKFLNGRYGINVPIDNLEDTFFRGSRASTRSRINDYIRNNDIDPRKLISRKLVAKLNEVINKSPQNATTEEREFKSAFIDWASNFFHRQENNFKEQFNNDPSDFLQSFIFDEDYDVTSKALWALLADKRLVNFNIEPSPTTDQRMLENYLYFISERNLPRLMELFDSMPDGVKERLTGGDRPMFIEEYGADRLCKDIIEWDHPIEDFVSRSIFPPFYEQLDNYLEMAVRLDRQSSLDTIISAFNAYPNTVFEETGKTPFHYACENQSELQLHRLALGQNYVSRRDLLLTRLGGLLPNAELSIMDNSGNAPIHYAVKNANPDFIQAVVSYIPRHRKREILNLCNSKGQTPLDIVQSNYTASEEDKRKSIGILSRELAFYRWPERMAVQMLRMQRGLDNLSI